MSSINHIKHLVIHSRYVTWHLDLNIFGPFCCSVPHPPGYGLMTDGYTTFINSSTCTVSFQPTNPPIVFDLPNPGSSWNSPPPFFFYSPTLLIFKVMVFCTLLVFKQNKKRWMHGYVIFFKKVRSYHLNNDLLEEKKRKKNGDFIFMVHLYWLPC